MLTEKQKVKQNAVLFAQQILDALKVAALKEPGAQEALLKICSNSSQITSVPMRNGVMILCNFLKFWTNSTEQNACLVADDEHYYYNFSHIWKHWICKF